jgi:hypothetical protein
MLAYKLGLFTMMGITGTVIYYVHYAQEKEKSDMRKGVERDIARLALKNKEKSDE